ncbi:hypothetical protein I3760_01G104900 [Carya illinoinensis]|nr:hypothetical protein I3760_01G104900 [Carya illinoinensis]
MTSAQATNPRYIFRVYKFIALKNVGEVGELSEIFQWKGEVPRGLPDWKDEGKEHLGEELSDVLLYLVRLSDICGVDLGKAALRKLELNAIKYPVKLCKASSKKPAQVNVTDNNDGNSNGGVMAISNSNSKICSDGV